MAIGLPRPTGKGVRDFHAKRIRDWDECIRKDEKFRDIVYNRNKVEILTENSELRLIKPYEYHSGRAGGIIDQATGLLMALPEFHGDPANLTTEEKRDVEQVEKVAASLFEQQLLANDFWNHVTRDVLIYSRAFVKAIPLPHVWTTQAGYPVRGIKEPGKKYLAKIREWKTSEGRFPFVITHVPALSILPHLDANDNILASIEEKIVTAKVLADELGSKKVKEALSRQTLKWYDELTVIEYMDTEWVAYLLVDTTPVDKSTEKLPHERVRSYEVLRTWRHGLGKHPIVMIPGIRTEMDDYMNRFKGFLSDAKDPLIAYDALLSRLATMVLIHYLPSYTWTIPMDTAKFKGRSKRPTLQINLGGVTPLYTDEVLGTLPIPQGLPDATLLLQRADDDIQRGCVVARDKLLLADGRQVTYGELAQWGGKFEVLVPDGRPGDKGATSAWAYAFPSGNQAVYEISLESGEKYRFSDHHKVALNGRANSRGMIKQIKGRRHCTWTESDKIKAGDYILALNKVDTGVDQKLRWMTPDLALLVGLMLSDGCFSEQPLFRNISPEILALFEETARRVGQPITRGKDFVRLTTGIGKGGNQGKNKKVIKDTPLIKTAKRLGLMGVTAKDKKLPPAFNRLPSASAAALLRGLLLGDGHITKGGQISFGSFSVELRDWVASTAHRLGCPGRIATRTRLNGDVLYDWYSFSEFADSLVATIGGLPGKINQNKLGLVRPARTRRRLNDKLHRLKVLSVKELPPELTICVTVLEGDSHVYCDRKGLLTHNTFDDVLFGRVEGNVAGHQVNLRINMSKQALKPLAQHMAQGLTNVFELFLRGVQQLKEAVIIDGEKITVSMAKKYQNRLSVQIEPKSPIDRSQDMGAAAMALDLGFPWDWVAEKIVGVENPATLRLEKDIQEIEKLPEVQQRLQQDTLELLEIMVEDDELTDLEGIDLDALPPEVAEAVQRLLGGGGGEEDVLPIPTLGGDEGGEPPAPFANPPAGAAPQRLSPRGAGTPNRQPSLDAAEVGFEGF